MSERQQDEDLVLRIRAGDEAAFTDLYRRWQGPIYRFAYRMSGRAALAEDATQEVFMALIQTLDRYDPRRGPLGSYLYGMARNHVLAVSAKEAAPYTVSVGEVKTWEMSRAGKLDIPIKIEMKASSIVSSNAGAAAAAASAPGANGPKSPASAAQQPLCQWAEIANHPGLLTACLQTSNNPVILMVLLVTLLSMSGQFTAFSYIAPIIRDAFAGGPQAGFIYAKKLGTGCDGSKTPVDCNCNTVNGTGASKDLGICTVTAFGSQRACNIHQGMSTGLEFCEAQAPVS